MAIQEIYGWPVRAQTLNVSKSKVSLDQGASFIDLDEAIGRTSVYVKPSGDDDSSAVVAALATIAAGDAHRLVLRDYATYTLTQALTAAVGAAGFAIDGNGATLNFAGGGSTATMLDIAGTETTIGTLASDAAAGATTLTLTTTSGLSARDTIMLVSGSANSWATGVAVGEMVRVLTVDDATTVTLLTPLAYAYTAADTVTVTRLSGGPVSIRDLTAVGIGDSAASQVAINCRNVPVTIRGVDLTGFDSTGVRLRRVPGATVTDLRVRNGRTPGLAYGLAIDRGTRDVTVTASHFEELRHGVTAGGSLGVVRNVIVSGCHATACREAGLDMHPGCDEFKFLGNIIEFSTDAESDGDGIIGQGPRFAAVGNTITGFKRHGVFHQVAGGQSHIVPVGVISDNTMSAATGSGTRVGVLVQPGGTMCAPGKYYIDRNRGPGTNLSNAVTIDTQGDNIAWVEVTNNDIPDTSALGIHVIADTGTAVLGGTITHNHVGGGTNEAIYLQGVDADGIRDLLVAYNRSAGGSNDLRIANALRVDYGRMVGGNVTVSTSGLSSCRAIGGPNTPEA